MHWASERPLYARPQLRRRPRRLVLSVWPHVIRKPTWDELHWALALVCLALAVVAGLLFNEGIPT